MNELGNASNILDPTMFVDDTNLFFSHKDIRYLFQIVNQELENINQCTTQKWMKSFKDFMSTSSYCLDIIRRCLRWTTPDIV